MLSFGYYTCLGAILNNLLTSFGYSSLQTSIMGVCFIFWGLVGSFVASGLLDKTKKYLFMLKVILVGTFVCTIGYCFSLPSKNFFLVCLNGSLSGLFTLPILPVAFNFSVELTHPVSEAMSNGIMVTLSRVVGIVMTYIGTYLANKYPLWCIGMFAISVFVGVIASFQITEDLRRVRIA